LVLKIDWNWIHQKNATLCIEIWQLQYIASYSRKCCCYNIVRHTWVWIQFVVKHAMITYIKSSYISFNKFVWWVKVT
jgi:hypothetical protein